MGIEQSVAAISTSSQIVIFGCEPELARWSSSELSLVINVRHGRCFSVTYSQLHC